MGNQTPSPNPQRADTTAALAAKLGLSRWAVSRAINGRPGISQATAARVQAAIREQHFTPDPLARGLRGGASGWVAVCFPRPLLQPITSGDAIKASAVNVAGLNFLLNQLEQSGLNGLLVATNPESELPLVRRALALRPEALVLVLSRFSADDFTSQVSAQWRLPCLAIEPTQALPVTTVRVDLAQGARMALSHAAKLGHNRFALLGFHPSSAGAAAFTQAATQTGINWRNQSRLLHEGDLDTLATDGVAYGWALADALLRRKMAATALFAASDEIALGALSRLRQAGKVVPRDFSLIGSGNVSLAAYCDPPLSTLDWQNQRLYEQAARTICEQIRRADSVETQEILVNPLFLKRASTGPPPL